MLCWWLAAVTSIVGNRDLFDFLTYFVVDLNYALAPLMAMSGSTVALSQEGMTVANNKGTIVMA